MAKKVTKSQTTAQSKAAPAIAELAGEAIKTTRPRNSSVPPKTRSIKPATLPGAKAGKASGLIVTYEMIAERAYHLWQAGMPGSEADHWFAAERELKND